MKWTIPSKTIRLTRTSPLQQPQIYEAGDDWWLVTGDWWCESCSRCKPPQTHRHCQAAGDRIIVPHGLEPWSRTPWRWKLLPSHFLLNLLALKIFLLRWKDSRVQADGLKHWWGVCRLLVDACCMCLCTWGTTRTCMCGLPRPAAMVGYLKVVPFFSLIWSSFCCTTESKHCNLCTLNPRLPFTDGARMSTYLLCKLGVEFRVQLPPLKQVARTAAFLI